MSQYLNPLQDLVVLQERMNRLFEDATQRRARGEAEQGDELESAEWYPAADVYESDGEYIVALDLPAIDRQALDISVDSNRLEIRGTRSIENRPLHRSERPRGKFLRTFIMPGSVNQQLIQADYKDGVLQIHLPKLGEQEPKRVEIKIT